MFEAQYKDDIQKRMITQLEKSSDKTTIDGSFSRDIINANSIEFENAYAEMGLIVDASRADTSWGEYLTKLCSEYGVDRKAATRASGLVTFSGTARTVIPEGTLIQTYSGTQFQTDEDIVIGESGTESVNATAILAGSSGNVEAGSIIQIPISIVGVASVTNEKAMTGGYNAESDEDLRARYYEMIRTPATSGNANHYHEWAMSVTGVGAAKVKPLWNGPGTVEVLILDSNGNTADEKLISDVSSYIESVRPIGATVTVRSPTTYPINVSVDIMGALNETIFKKGVSEYLKSYDMDARKIYAPMLSQFITNQSSVIDYDNLLINGQERIALTDLQHPILGEVTVNAMATDG